MGLAFLFEAKNVFSQDRSGILTFKPNFQQQQSSKDILIKQWAEQYKKSQGIKELYIYKEVVLNLSSCCEASGNSRECFEKSKEILEGYNWAIGRCKELEGGAPEICAAIRKNDCSIFVDDLDNNVCQGYLNFDPQLLKKGLAVDGDIVDMGSVRRSLAYYSVFKNKNVLTCRQLLKDDAYFLKVGCKILLSSEPQDVIDNYALDFAYYYYSERENKKSECSNIKDEYVRGYCESGVSVSRFVDKYFLGAK